MVKLEVFSGDPPCPGCVAIIDLAQRVAAKYPGELELTILKGQEAMAKFEAYKLFCVPAAVVNSGFATTLAARGYAITLAVEASRRAVTHAVGNCSATPPLSTPRSVDPPPSAQTRAPRPYAGVKLVDYTDSTTVAAPRTAPRNHRRTTESGQPRSRSRG